MIAALILALQAMSPQSASPDLRCIVDRISAADRAALGQSARRGDESLGPAGERFEDAAVGCARELTWTPQRASDMSALSLSLIFQDESGRLLQEAGMPVGEIDAWFQRQSEGVRTEPDVSEDTSTRLVETLNGQGVALDRVQASGQLIGVYLAARVMIERFRLGLPIVH